jgi:hypothetical protein
MLDSIFAKAAVLCGFVTIGTPTEVIKMRMVTNVELLELGRIP